MLISKLKKSTQNGTSLIEVLIAIIVMSIGLLGMAGLTASSSSYNKLGQIRSTAMLLVSDYTDRARANLTAFDNGLYAKTSAYAFSTTLAAQSGCTNASSAACNPSGMASLDQTQWSNLLLRKLPGGNAYVTTSFSSTTNERFMDIWVMWAEVGQEAGFAIASGNTCPTAASAPSSVKCMYFRVAI